MDDVLRMNVEEARLNMKEFAPKLDLLRRSL